MVGTKKKPCSKGLPWWPSYMPQRPRTIRTADDWTPLRLLWVLFSRPLQHLSGSGEEDKFPC